MLSERRCASCCSWSMTETASCPLMFPSMESPVSASSRRGPTSARNVSTSGSTGSGGVVAGTDGTPVGTTDALGLGDGVFVGVGVADADGDSDAPGSGVSPRGMRKNAKTAATAKTATTRSTIIHVRPRWGFSGGNAHLTSGCCSLSLTLLSVPWAATNGRAKCGHPREYPGKGCSFRESCARRTPSE